jgi:hypothetical protein
MRSALLLPFLVTAFQAQAAGPAGKDSAAIAVAKAHVDAWSHHDLEKARQSLASDVHITVTTTAPIKAPTDTKGVDAYMEGLKKFAGAVEPGSAKVIASIGDDKNALLLVTVRASFGPNGPKVTLPAARLYLVDDDRKIKVEQVIFFQMQN